VGRTVAIVLFLNILCFAVAAFGVDRQPSQAEIERIEQIRQMIEQEDYTWQAGVTSVSHLSPEEFRQLLGLRVPVDFEARRARAIRDGRIINAIDGMAFPSSFDWRTESGVTPIKSQGSCGSCWAFCAAAAMESHVLIFSGLEEDLSEQAVLSCNTVGDGCGGGWMETAYDLWIDHGAVREVCMPYHAVDTDPCIQESCEVAATLGGYYYVGENIDDLKQAVLGGPVAVAMAACGGFSAYTGGCYQDTCTEINHGVTIVGWDDAMCGGDGAWIVKNSWGPDWGDNGYIYMKYGTCYVGYGAQALTYTPAQTVHFFRDLHTIDDSSGDADGFPEKGETIVLAFTIVNIGAETATGVDAVLRALTPGIDVTDSTVTYPDIPKGETRESDMPHFTFTVSASAPSCGGLEFHLVVSSDQGSSHINLTIPVGETVAVFSDDFVTDQGWTVGAVDDDATTGIWERGDPEGTWWGDQPVQPEDDHTPVGTYCYVTGAAGGSSQGTNDVDGGKTTLFSPVIDLSDKGSAILTYSRWYASETGSNPNDDDLIVDVSNDNGTNWHNLETLNCSARRWIGAEFYLEDYVTLTDQMKFRFIAQDNGLGGSIVEAGIDDFVIAACETTAADTEPPTVTVIAPDGGEVVIYGANYDIQWSAADNVDVTSVTILLSTDGGSSFPDTVAAGETNDGSYTWPVPDVDSKTARIRVVAYDAAMNEGLDTSDADFTLRGTISGIEIPGDPEVPADVVLTVANVNPIAPNARIVYGIPTGSNVTLQIYDVSGRYVTTLASGNRAEGYHVVDWNGGGRSGSRVSPGIYFVKLDCPEGRRTAKIVVTR
jgi:C1A family cysteine protease